MSKLLVVVDMQIDFITGALGNSDSLSIVPNVVNRIKECVSDDYDVVFTMETLSLNSTDSQGYKVLPVKRCIDGTSGWFLNPDIELALHNAILGSDSKDTIYLSYACFTKNTFGSCELAEFIKEQGYSEIELIGICTDISAVSNAILIKSFVPESTVRVNTNCCAWVEVSPERRNMALGTMKCCNIEFC